jgi:hypothetical protein
MKSLSLSLSLSLLSLLSLSLSLSLLGSMHDVILGFTPRLSDERDVSKGCEMPSG